MTSSRDFVAHGSEFGSRSSRSTLRFGCLRQRASCHKTYKNQCIFMVFEGDAGSALGVCGIVGDAGRLPRATKKEREQKRDALRAFSDLSISFVPRSGVVLRARFWLPFWRIFGAPGRLFRSKMWGQKSSCKKGRFFWYPGSPCIDSGPKMEPGFMTHGGLSLIHI